VGRLARRIIRDGLLVTQDPSRRVLRGDLVLEDERIAEVGGHAKGDADETIDAHGGLVLPGLINAHTHVAMTLLRGAVDDLRLEDFLERTFAIDAVRGPADVRIGAELGCVELLLSGTTSFVDLYYFEDEIAQAAEATGARGFLAWVVLDEALTTQKGSPLRNCEAFIRSHRRRPRIHPLVGLMGVYVCSKETVLAAKELGEQYQLPVHLHLAETRKEIYDHERKTGQRPVEWLDQLGFFRAGDFAAHGAWLTLGEVRTLARAGVGIAHCPVSNLKLASGGVAPVPELLAEGAPVGLGTDGASTNNGLDMFAEMKAAALLHKGARWDATVLPAQQALDLATIGGARLIGMEAQLGSLEVGKLADVVVLRPDSPRLVPTTPENAVANLVYAAQGGDVRTVFVDGRAVVRDGAPTQAKLGDLLRRSAEAAHDLLRRAG